MNYDDDDDIVIVAVGLPACICVHRFFSVVTIAVVFV